MFHLHNIKNGKNENRNIKWSYIPDNPYRTLIIGASGSGKTKMHCLI